MHRTATTTLVPTASESTTPTVPTVRPRGRSRRIALAAGAAAVLVGLGAIGAEVLTGADSARPAVVVSQSAPGDGGPTSSADIAAAADVVAAADVDVAALWSVMLELDAHQVSVIVPALDPGVREDLEAIVRAVAGTGH